MIRRSETTASPPALLLALLLLVLALSGCPQRQEIIEQTVAVKADNVASQAEASHVPEELLTWEMVDEIDPGFAETRAVAFDAPGALYVAGDEAVRKMTAGGQVEWELPVGGEPTCVTVDLEGTILVGMRQIVEVYDQSGQLLMTLAPEGQNTWITSIAAWPDDRFVADAGSRRILRYDRTGNPLSDFAGMDHERGIPALSIPSPHLDVAVGPDGNLWLANPGRLAVQIHSRTDGALLNSWRRVGNGVEGFGGCCNPTDIAVLPDGRVITSEKGLPRVKVYSAEGELLSVVVPPEEFARSTVGIDLAIDPSGRVAVLDPHRSNIRIYQETVQEAGDR
ncbi:MAG: NHL repeat-containing protein [Armatimonadota bacterium]